MTEQQFELYTQASANERNIATFFNRTVKKMEENVEDLVYLVKDK